MGDFNFIRSPDNRNTHGGSPQDMLLFNDIISSQLLSEIPIKGCSYTWSNVQSTPTLEHLDWISTSIIDWISNFPHTTAIPLAKPVSDHSPVLVQIHSSVPVSSLFRFENFWPSHPGFLETVSGCWNKPVRARDSASVVVARLKNVRHGLRNWSRSLSMLSLLITNCNKAILLIDDIEDVSSTLERSLEVIVFG